MNFSTEIVSTLEMVISFSGPELQAKTSTQYYQLIIPLELHLLYASYDKKTRQDYFLKSCLT